MRRFLRYIDYKIYLIKWKLTRFRCEFLLKIVKDEKKRDKILADWIYHPFSSRFDLPYPNIIEKLTNIK